MSKTEMPGVFSPADTNLDRKIVIRMGLLGLATLALAIAAVIGALAWYKAERERAERMWQDRLNIFAETRADAVSVWVSAQLNAFRALSENDSVRIYTQLTAEGTDGDPLAERQYLENLVLVFAGREGFNPPTRGTSVSANVPRPAVAGLAVLDRQLRPIVHTSAIPALPDVLAEDVESLFEQPRTILSDPYPAPDTGLASVTVMSPIAGAQNDRPVGVVVGTKPVSDELFPLLRQPGDDTRTGEAILVVRRGDAITYLSPLKFETAEVLSKTLSRTTPGLVAARATEQAGVFNTGKDYAGQDVLMTSRAIAGTDWVLMYKVGREEALAGTEALLARLLAGALLAIALLTTGVFAVWRHGASRRAERASGMYQELAERFEHQAGFIRQLTDTLPNAVFISNDGGVVRFANRAFARSAGGEDEESLVGKNLNGVLGPHEARAHTRAIEDTVESGRKQEKIERADAPDGRVTRSHYLPLNESRFTEAGVLVVQEDLTSLVQAQERAQQVTDDVVAMLVSLVDQRDPNSTHHSQFVNEIACAVADEMNATGIDRDTIDKASRLMNIGKMFVPVDVLTKQSQLSDDEYATVQQAVARGYDLLSQISFEGPVVETLRQTREKIDGSGQPDGLKGEDILLPARVIAAVNAFVAMISTRSYREAMTIDAAMQELNSGAGIDFDRRVVAALVNIVENKGGRERWTRQPAG